MGSFEKYVYSDGTWTDAPRGSEWLSIDIHDSSFATVEFAPADSARGLFYVGFHPRDYFEDPTASAGVDSEGEAQALCEWLQQTVGHSASVAEILALMAKDGEEEPPDIFVEETVCRLLTVLGLPIPDDLDFSD